MRSATATARARAGMTLVELLAVLAILGTSLLVAALTFRRTAGEPPEDLVTVARRAVVDARTQAVERGVPITVSVLVMGAPTAITAFPDGSVVGAGVLGFGRADGRLHDPAATERSARTVSGTR